MQMTFILIYWLGNLQALLAQTAQALPFLILMTLLAGRKGNAALCLWGGRQLLRLGLFCAALSLPLFPLMLLLETLRQPQMPPLADLLVQPASVALLAWLPATLLLWGLLRASRHWPDATDLAITAYRTSDLRLTLWGCLLALLLFLLGSLLSTRPCCWSRRRAWSAATSSCSRSVRPCTCSSATSRWRAALPCSGSGICAIARR